MAPLGYPTWASGVRKKDMHKSDANMSMSGHVPPKCHKSLSLVGANCEVCALGYVPPLCNTCVTNGRWNSSSDPTSLMFGNMPFVFDLVFTGSNCADFSGKAGNFYFMSIVMQRRTYIFRSE